MKRLIVLLAACALLLCSCATPVTSPVAAVTLPPAQSPYAAPADDMGLAYQTAVPLYLPSRDGQRLVVQYVDLVLRRDQSNARDVLEALIGFRANDYVLSLGGNTRLSLASQSPVEVSGGVCTVNLASSALQLDEENLYTVCLAIAATMGELPGVDYVNVLIAGQAVAMDITGCLPLGTLSHDPAGELPVLWDQMHARRPALGKDPSTAPVSATATLYFPLADGSGFMPETRTIAFPGQSPAHLALELVNALSAGAQYVPGAVAMPNMTGLLNVDPIVTELEDGGRLLTLRFNAGLEDRLRHLGIEPACFLGAVHRTLVTFIPSISAVRMYDGETMLTSLYSTAHGSLLFPEGVMRRHHFDSYLMEQVTVFLGYEDQLRSVSRTVPHGEARSLHALLEKLMQGALPLEKAEGFFSPIAPGLDRSDVLGLSVKDDTLLVNFSGRMTQHILETDNELILCYSLVNTLCDAAGVQRVRFYFDGDVAGMLSGSLYWGGEFLRSPGLIR